MKLSFVLGTRPEILKLAAVVTEARRRGHDCRVTHTGQHYDHLMSAVFFEELDLPEPDEFLDVGSGSHATQTALALPRLEAAFERDQPDAVVVLGDTNATLSAALVASKMCLPVVHIEAGARCFDWTIPEEINRTIVDSVASACLAPTETALRNLVREGAAARSYLVGDTLSDVALGSAPAAAARGQLLRAELGLEEREYALVTSHRGQNTDDLERLSAIVGALEDVAIRTVVPLHPRTRARLKEAGLLERLEACCLVLEPMGYLSFLGLLQGARVVITDSGGVQQEAAIFSVSCVTLRNVTEWTETLDSGMNVLVDADRARIVAAVDERASAPADAFRKPSPFTPGSAASVALIEELWEAGRLRIQTSAPSAPYDRSAGR